MRVFKCVPFLVEMEVYEEVYSGICVLVVGCVCSHLCGSRLRLVGLVGMGICS